MSKSRLEFPPQLNPDGTLKLSTLEDVALQSIRQILSVSVSEVVFAPVYGSVVGQFEAGSVNSNGEQSSQVRRSIDAWLEPEFWAIVDTEHFDPEMSRVDLVNWASTNVSVVPLPPT